MNATHSSAPDAVVLRTEHLGRRVGDVAIVSDISLDVRRAELLGIVGASGSGKSSFLRLLNRLDQPTGGSVLLEGMDYRQFSPRELRRRVKLALEQAHAVDSEDQCGRANSAGAEFAAYVSAGCGSVVGNDGVPCFVQTEKRRRSHPIRLRRVEVKTTVRLY